MFETIVAGVDGGDGGRDALALAAAFAALWNANLIAVRVYPRGGADGPFAHEAPLRHEAETGLARDLSDAGMTSAAPFVVGGRTVAAGLRRTADAVEADLVVVGAPRRDAVAGPCAEDAVGALLEDAHCPVAVAARDARAGGLPPDAIAVGMPEADSPRPLEDAVAIARRTAASLMLLAAVPLPRDLDVDGFFLEEVLERYQDDTRRRARELRDRRGIDARGIATIGPAADALVDISRSVDLLVVGSQRCPAGPGRLGRTAGRVIREASCDVLVVPPGVGAEALEPTADGVTHRGVATVA
jgi:nucleotide-binding universal stress UspA family protein